MSHSQSVPYQLFLEPNKTANEIIDFSRLPKGWHYGRGGPISLPVCIWALQLNSVAIESGFPVTEAFPGVDGEVMVSAYYRRHTLDFTIYPDGHVAFRHELDDDEVEYAENLTLDTAKRKLTILGTVLWNSSVSFILSTSAKKEAPSKTSPSSQVQMAEESPLSTEDVRWKRVNLYAVTS